MATKVIMPKAGMAMEQGTVVKWFRREGETVVQGEPLLEILTDKVNMEIEAEASGTLLKIVAPEGTVLPVLRTIAYIGEEGERIEESDESRPTITEKAEPLQERVDHESYEYASPPDEKKRATPAARAEARVRDLNITEIAGTGPKGRVQKDDVLKHGTVRATPLAQKIAAERHISLHDVSGSGYAGKIRSEDIYDRLCKPATLQDEMVAMSPMRQVIAKRMSESYFTAPVFSLEIEVDMLRAKNMLDDIREPMLRKYQVKPTMTDLIIFATARGLQSYPQLNASLEGDRIRRYGNVNMALAVGLDEGLMVPVIQRADQLAFHELVAKRTDLVQRTLGEKLLPDETVGSSFTISNLGMYGIKSFTSIINQPNSAILGVGAMIDTVVPRDGEIVVRPIMSLILTIDHRVVDGAKGAEFLSHLKNILENPLQLFV